MTSKLLLEKYFKDVWNYNPPPFDIIHKPGNPTKGGKASSYYGREQFGRPYFMPVSLGPNPSGPALQLRNPVIKISGRKTIVETSMVNSIGTVKELISREDYKINIKGIIVREDNMFPINEIKELDDYYKRNTVLFLRSVLTDLFLDKGQVVMTDLTWPELVGIENVKPYEINLVSDSPFKLFLDNV
ncbi:DUF6046 domain-containing protein [Chitinophaga varians]|uniref:DUF6046 domain-containing protein n=1 Tax=Chitinophaga varians TaxID=2202339 RepID=UPI00165F570A|nr:DUF6046 domain-containing protein [Chitinophaga varians]MBC9915016.1 hypothetical protein [Chitinophaga varians]